MTLQCCHFLISTLFCCTVMCTKRFILSEDVLELEYPLIVEAKVIVNVVVGLINVGSTCALLATLLTATADKVITRSCGTRGLGFRVRHYPTDTAATILIADNCQLDAIDTDDFNGLPYIMSIDLEQNQITNIHPEAFRNVSRLTLLDLNRNKLRDLPVFAEQSCPNLAILNLRENSLSILNNPNALSACKKLEKIYLSRNNIEYLHADLFSGLTELKMLLLNNNRITFIYESLLINNGKLETLDIQNNKLAFLPSNLTNRSLKNIGFDGNPFNCACLIEFLGDLKRKGVKYDYWIYNGLAPKCVFTGLYPCNRHPPSGILSPPAGA